MAAFNTVSVARLSPCPRCGHSGQIHVQFAYGDTWQYEYRLGDQVRWGGNDVGRQQKRVEVLAYPEACPKCGLDIAGDYVLSIDHNVISGYRLAGPRETI